MKKFLIIFILFVGLWVVTEPIVMLAQQTEYELLTPLPLGSSEPTTKTTASQYIPGMVMLIIGVAGVLAVIKMIFGGILYMSTDAIGGKSEAKGHIQNALWGLLLIIGSYIILYTINPKLLDINLEIKPLPKGTSFETEFGTLPSLEVINKTREDLKCQNCAAVTPGATTMGNIPPKIPGGCDGSVCFIHNELASKLQGLTNAINKANEGVPSGGQVKWQITEMFPPTVDHAHPCHKIDTSVSAKCVDVAVRGLSCANSNSCSGAPLSRDAGKLSIFMNEAFKLGLKVVYEVPNANRRDALIRELNRRQVNGVAVIVVNRNPPISEHFSVYSDQAVYNTR